MSNQFHHGLSNRDHTDSQGFIRETPTNVIGLVAFADDADAQFYPLHTPVLITNINTGLAKAGVHGNLRKSLETIQPIVNPTIVVVRIPSPFLASGFDASRVIGTTQADGKRTGLQALLTAKTRLGVVPKINIVPNCETPDVINALININKKLRAFSYATPRDAQGKMLATKEEVVAFRKTLGDKEIMLVWPEFTAGNVLQSEYAEIENTASENTATDTASSAVTPSDTTSTPTSDSTTTQPSTQPSDVVVTPQADRYEIWVDEQKVATLTLDELTQGFNHQNVKVRWNGERFEITTN